jgi:hypothetical protein
MMRPDEDIRAEITAELRWDPLLNADDVMVWLLNGAVALTGSVAERGDVWRASLIAARVAGVRSVTNHLEVKRSAGGRASPSDQADARVVVLLPIPRPPFWEIEDWVEDVDSAPALPPPA